MPLDYYWNRLQEALLSGFVSLCISNSRHLLRPHDGRFSNVLRPDTDSPVSHGQEILRKERVPLQSVYRPVMSTIRAYNLISWSFGFPVAWNHQPLFCPNHELSGLMKKTPHINPYCSYLFSVFNSGYRGVSLTMVGSNSSEMAPSAFSRFPFLLGSSTRVSVGSVIFRTSHHSTWSNNTCLRVSFIARHKVN